MSLKSNTLQKALQMAYRYDLHNIDNIKSIEVYGIRTSIFGLKEKGVVKDLFNGIFQYAKLLHFELVNVSREPIGPMTDMLEKMDFQGTTKPVHLYTAPNTVDIIDLGCKDEILTRSINDTYYTIMG